MKLTFQISILCLFLYGGQAFSFLENKPESSSGSSQFKVMTFNIRYKTIKDGVNRWMFRRSLVVDVIDAYSADILCLQEAQPSQVDYILKKTKRRYVAYGVVRSRSKEDESTKILVNPNVFSVKSDKTFWLSDQPDVVGSTSYGNEIPRIATQITLVHKKTGKSLVVTNTHLDHQSESARIKGVEQIVETLKRYRRILVVGDFNNQRNDAQEIKVMESEGYSDTYFELHNTRPATFHKFKGDAEAIFPSKIDHIWRKGDLKPISAHIIKTKSQFFNRYPSDHFPVTCTLELL